MQFWPLALGALGSGLIALSLIVIMMKLQRPDVSGKSPHHKANIKSDLIAAQAAETAE